MLFERTSRLGMRIAFTATFGSFRRSDMLMITRSEGSDLTQMFKVEGKLLGPWIGELESACVGPISIRSECSSTSPACTFVDAEGARLLKGLIRDGARVIACSGFVAEMLHHEWP